MISTTYEPQHDKTNKMSVRPEKTQISLGIAQPDQSSLCTQWVAKDPSFLHGDSEDSDQTGRMPRLIRVFAVGTAIFLVLSCPGSNDWQRKSKNQSVTSTNLLLSVNFHGDALQIIFELPHDQTNNMTCASSEDSDQTKPIK